MVLPVFLIFLIVNLVSFLKCKDFSIALISPAVVSELPVRFSWTFWPFSVKLTFHLLRHCKMLSFLLASSATGSDSTSKLWSLISRRFRFIRYTAILSFQGLRIFWPSSESYGTVGTVAIAKLNSGQQGTSSKKMIPISCKRKIKSLFNKLHIDDGDHTLWSAIRIKLWNFVIRLLESYKEVKSKSGKVRNELAELKIVYKRMKLNWR